MTQILGLFFAVCTLPLLAVAVALGLKLLASAPWLLALALVAPFVLR